MHDLKREKELIDKLHLILSTTEEEFNNNPEFFIEEGERLLKEYDDILSTRSTHNGRRI